jgi:hypothetical protein
MNHSTWDLEVHAREMQRRRLHEADRARLIETARQRPDHARVPATRFNISRLMAALQYYLSPRRRSNDRAAVPAPAAAALLPLPLEEPRLSPDARSAGLSQPYAGMVVLARGTRTKSTPQPCAAGDC